MSVQLALVIVAALMAIAPLPPSLVERFYSNGLYPPLQAVLTAATNRTAVALFDVLAVVAIIWWGALLVVDLRARRGTVPGVLRRTVMRTATGAAVLYLVFLITWGMNYRRVALDTRLRADLTQVTPERQRSLAASAVVALNRLHGASRVAPAPSDGEAATTAVAAAGIDPSLAGAFEAAQRAVGLQHDAVPGRPKRSLVLDWYFRLAGVDGMTDPYFLETLVLSDVLAVERPMVVAHEWAHLAGHADEGEANFLGWLTCLHGPPAAQYSGWLFLYSEAVRGLSEADRRLISARLEAGPRADLQAIRQRLVSSVSPAISTAGWQLYDGYLKANRVASGTESYTEVVRLVLSTALGSKTLERQGNR